MVDCMKNLKILLSIIFFLSYFAIEAEALYVRKIKEPEFFIPQQDRMHKPEKLPPIKTLIEEKQVVYKIPEYKNKYNQYVEEIESFVKTNMMPENKDLNEDLNMMSSGEIFEVKDEDIEEVATKEQKEFYFLTDKIMQN